MATGMGFVGMFAVIALLEALARWALAQSYFSWEIEFLRAVETYSPISFSTAIWLQTIGTDITLALLVVVTAGFCAWNHRPIAAISIVLAMVVVDLVVRFGWTLWDRARPDLIAQGLASPDFHSFPSGHTAKTVAVYGLLASLWWRATDKPTERTFILALLAFVLLVVPYGRLRMGVHWPSDILGGYIIGLIWLIFLLWAARFERRTR
jgi:undecaprenyl-diphosphatase